jgi:hypothetical protein
VYFLWTESVAVVANLFIVGEIEKNEYDSFNLCWLGEHERHLVVCV